MEMLIIAVALYLVYTVVNRFEPTIDGIVDASNLKVDNMVLKQKAKYAKDRNKLQTKAEDLGEVISVKDLNNLLDGKKSKAKKK
jgi:hypothetical protein